MIVDIHTHIFPPRFIEARAQLATTDPAFGEMYGRPAARMATAEDLLASMERSGVDVSVACGFWWRDPALAEEHAAYLVEAARTSGGRIVPFVPVAAGTPGAAGVGEVREGSAEAIAGDTWPLLLHCSEAVGHAYPGKAGGLEPGGLWRLLEAQPGARVIAAHWGGGFPFYALMPEVRAIIDAGRLVFDTAASQYLYRDDVFRAAIDLVGPHAVCWGSDYPLLDQAQDRARVEAALPSQAERSAVLGGNAARFLSLES